MCSRNMQKISFIKMYIIIVILALANLVISQQVVKILFVMDKTQTVIPEWTGKILKTIEDNMADVKLDDQFVGVEIDNEQEQIDQYCNILGSGVSLVIDLSLPQVYPIFMNITNAFGIPYVKLDISISSFVQALDHYIVKRNGTDAALIFSNDADLEQAISYFIGQSILRIIVLDATDENSLKRLGNMRPSPSYYSMFGTTEQIREMYDSAQKVNLIYRFDRWNFIFFDYDYNQFLQANELNSSISILYPKDIVACRIHFKELPCDVSMHFDIFREILSSFLNTIGNMIISKSSDSNILEQKSYDCGKTDFSEFSNETRLKFYSSLSEELDTKNKEFNFDESKMLVRLNYDISINMINDENQMEPIASWSNEDGIHVETGKIIKETKAFYRIGTAEAIPWTFPVIDEVTGKIALNEDGTEKWTGYCIDFIDILAEKMNFDYELVIPKNGSFGKKVGPDKWDGVVGDLKEGKTDIAVAALTMTAEREEVIDFVAPYFEQTGIIIVMRKPIRQTSMFKFMTVLKMEVWLSILGALIVTAVLLWILDTYSPYSARNNKKAYPYPCRVFTLKESFWFALTSFTPQGGGEAPKAISGRTLVAAYWLFVVLMLATFTANLAAFLTVERMQTPVQSLEQLARQSRINYTVVEGSTTHEYFKNMKGAEDTLYRLWKELTLNATSDQSQYRVWDYPIKEQYGHILSAIQETGTLENASVGFQKVLDHDDFAFIHDSSQIKYEVTRNCNFTTIGELFAEQPFALAVQQGSHLQEELSKVILDLQKNRVFELLTGKYWNSSVRGTCSDVSDSEGISLESLGGVFIATLFGLALAMITLAGEVIYYKRKEKNEVHAIMDSIDKKKQQQSKPLTLKSPKLVTIGKTFKPVNDKLPRVSHISVFPRNTFQP